jgi:hypothetical protein
LQAVRRTKLILWRDRLRPPPTIRKVCSRPSSRTMVTVAPNRTSEMSPEAGTSCAPARRALQYLISRAAAAIDARSDEAWAAACAARASAPPRSLMRFHAAGFHRLKTRKPASRTAQGGISWGKSREWKLPFDKPAIAAAFPGAANLVQSASATAAAVPENPRWSGSPNPRRRFFSPGRLDAAYDLKSAKFVRDRLQSFHSSVKRARHK